MGIISIALSVLTGFAIVAFLTHFLIAIRFQRERVYLFFSFLSLGAAGYIFMTLLQYNTPYTDEYFIYLKIQIAAEAIFMISMCLFLYHFTATKIRKTLIVYSVLFTIFILARLLHPTTLTFSSIEGMIPHDFFWGDKIWFLHADVNIWSYLFFALVMAGYLLFFYMIILDFRATRRRSNKVLLISFSIFYIMILADLANVIFHIRAVYLTEFAFVLIVTLMSLYMTNDIFSLNMIKEQFQKARNTDAVTDLPTREFFLDRLQVFLDQFTENSSLAVIAIGIDNFRTIYNSHGMVAAEALLKIISDRIKKIPQISNSLSRIQVAEFAFFIHGFQRQEDLAFHIQILQNQMLKPFLIGNEGHYISLSVGIYSVYPEDKLSTNVLDRALSALQIAQNNGRNQCQFFSENITRIVSKRLNLENRLKRALLYDEIKVFYQPKINSRTGVIGGMEALVRWIDSDGSTILPSDFISVAEETGLIHEIGMIVLDQACSFTKMINQLLGQNLSVAVNISPVQLSGKDFVPLVGKILNIHKLSPKNIELEITETQIIYEKKFIEMLHEIKDTGIRIALDDFGTGYSSLAYLNRLPIQTLKIDRSFIYDLHTNTRNQSIVKIFLELARHFQMQTVAEGIEKEEHGKILTDLGCDYLQGYYYSPPVSESDFQNLLLRKAV